MSEIILREYPPNPNLLNYHTRRQLTRKMAEHYSPESAEYPEKWLHSLCKLEGIIRVDLLRHQIRLRKSEKVQWEQLTDALENRIRFHWDQVAIRTMTERKAPRRQFDLPDGLSFERRIVFEGVDHAENSSLAALLYEIPGITTLIFSGKTVTVKRGFNYSWAELNPPITAVLENYNPEE